MASNNLIGIHLSKEVYLVSGGDTILLFGDLSIPLIVGTRPQWGSNLGIKVEYDSTLEISSPSLTLGDVGVPDTGRLDVLGKSFSSSSCYFSNVNPFGGLEGFKHDIPRPIKKIGIETLR